MDYKLIDFEEHGDERGSLVAIEENRDIPFDVKRVYYIFENAKNVRRGFHAHLKLKQVLICVSGACKIHLDNGTETAEVLLDNPRKGLIIESNMWREMYDFTPGAVLLVLASEYYTEDDYIRDYEEFLKYVN